MNKHKTELLDKDLVKHLNLKEEWAYVALFDAYYHKLYLFAERYIYDSDKAHDIIQDLFVRIWERREPLLLKSESLRYYLFTAVRNNCLNYLRSLQIEDKNNERYLYACMESHNLEVLDNEELLKEIQMVLDSLPDRCRQICLLRFMDGYKYREIAEQLGINENTVKVQLFRGMNRLKKMMAEYDFRVVALLFGIIIVSSTYLI